MTTAQARRTGRGVEKKAAQPPSRPSAGGGDALAQAYEPKPQEREVLDRLSAFKAAAVPAKLQKGAAGGMRLDVEHADPAVGMAMLLASLGSRDLDFLDAFLMQLTNAATKGREPDEAAAGFMLAMVRDVEPRDQIEAMLAAQMAAVHMATMTAARRLNHVENIPQQDSASALFNKLARTFAAQVDALKRYRTGGEQKVTVQHVHVADGGQAIVGNVATGGGGEARTAGNPMSRRWAFEAAKRCAARSKRSGGRCKGPAVRGWTVCRFHGAGGGAPRGERHGQYRHGRRTIEAAQARALIRAALMLASVVALTRATGNCATADG